MQLCSGAMVQWCNGAMLPPAHLGHAPLLGLHLQPQVGQLALLGLDLGGGGGMEEGRGGECRWSGGEVEEGVKGEE